MTLGELRRRVDAITLEGGDYEVAHSLEDGLLRELVREWCPDPILLAEVERMFASPFPRYCA